MKWKNLTVPTRPVHNRLDISKNCYGSVLSRADDLPGFFLMIQLDASTVLDDPLPDCKREFLATMIPILESNLAEVRRLAAAENET